MKKSLLALSALTIIAASANANAADPNNWPYWYVGLNAGATMTGSDGWERGATSGDLDLERAFSYSGSIGYKPSNFRYEAEIGRVEQNIGSGASTGDSTATKLMGNVIYDFNTAGFSPFLGAGLGIVNVDLSSTNPATVNDDDTQVAYQLIGGLSFNNVLPQTDLSLAYKYLGTFSDLKASGAEFEYDAHTVEAGARFRF